MFDPTQPIPGLETSQSLIGYNYPSLSDELAAALLPLPPALNAPATLVGGDPIGTNHINDPSANHINNLVGANHISNLISLNHINDNLNHINDNLNHITHPSGNPFSANDAPIIPPSFPVTTIPGASVATSITNATTYPPFVPPSSPVTSTPGASAVDDVAILTNAAANSVRGPIASAAGTVAATPVGDLSTPNASANPVPNPSPTANTGSGNPTSNGVPAPPKKVSKRTRDNIDPTLIVDGKRIKKRKIRDEVDWLTVKHGKGKENGQLPMAS